MIALLDKVDPLAKALVIGWAVVMYLVWVWPFECDEELQREAVELVRELKQKKYWLLLPGPVKAFFRKLAAHLRWTDLEAVLK
jgi:hypothetical protein